MTTTEAPVARRLEVIDLGLVRDNPWQPRESMDAAELQELADSIREHGLWQQPTVRPVLATMDGPLAQYELAFGHRRLAAMRLLGWTSAELEVRTLSDRQMAVIALGENTKRKDLSPIEQYRAWKKALEIEGLSVSDLAQSVGLDRSTVSNNLRLLSLPEWVLQYVESGELSAHGAREFLCLQGGDGHFHEDEAHLVMNRLTSGTPDWRVGRIRYEIDDVVTGQSVSKWRRLFGGDTPGGGHQMPPLFMPGAFKQEAPNQVHMLPNDTWKRTDGASWAAGPTNGRLQKEGSREWTCAVDVWARRQAQASKTGAKVAAKVPAGAAAVANFKTVLSADPVYAAVSSETEGTLMKAFDPDGMTEQIIERLGTRAAPVLLSKTGFKAPVDQSIMGGYWPNMGVTEVPAYFPDVSECRKTCTIGATYATFDEKGQPKLWCLNKQHFEEKVAIGRQRTVAKVGRQVEAINTADGKLLAALTGAPSAQLWRVLAAALLGGERFDPVEADNVDYRVREEFRGWPDNTRRIFEIVGSVPATWTPKSLLGAIAALSDEVVDELVMRLLVEEAHDAAVAEYVKPAAGAETSRRAPASEAEAAVQAEALDGLAARSRS